MVKEDSNITENTEKNLIMIKGNLDKLSSLLSQHIKHDQSIEDIIKKKPTETSQPTSKDEKKSDNSSVNLEGKSLTFTNLTTVNASGISKFILDFIATKYEGKFVKDYLFKKDYDEDKSIENLIYCILNIFKIMRIFNQDFFVKILVVLSDVEEFNKMFELINEEFSEEERNVKKKFFIDSFFLKIDPQSKTMNMIYKDKINELEKKLQRDKSLYKEYYSGDEENKILMNQFFYDFLPLNNQDNLNRLLVNKPTGAEFGNILLSVIDNILKMQTIYESYSGKIATIDEFYKTILDKNNRIFTFVKYRQDTPTINPRYSIYIDEKNFLNLKYCNIDGLIGFSNPNNLETYSYEDAKNFIESQTSNNEYYTFGPFNGIYPNQAKYDDNKKIAKDFSVDILKKLIGKGENVCIIPMGQSGSGKTSSVIFFSVFDPETKKTLRQDGIMVEMCNQDEFTDHFDKIKMRMMNIYLKHGPNTPKVTTLSIPNKKKIDSEPSFIFKDGHWVYENNNEVWMSESINNAFENREVEPTPNNENSSRSHVIVCLQLFVKNTDKFVYLIVCDLAGVENKFQSESMREIKKFDERYQISNKYKSKHPIFDNYFRADNATNDNFSSADEYRVYNDSKQKIQDVMSAYYDIIKDDENSSAPDGKFSDFNDLEEFGQMMMKCDLKLNPIEPLENEEKTMKYIEKLEKLIEETAEKTKLAKKVKKLYEIINTERNGKKISGIEGFLTSKEAPTGNKDIIKNFPEFFDLGLTFDTNNQMRDKIDNEIFSNSTTRDYNYDKSSKTTSFAYYIKNNELLNYFDLVVYLKYIGEIEPPVTFSAYKPVIKGIPHNYYIFSSFKAKIAKKLDVKTKKEYETIKKRYFSYICQYSRVLKFYYNSLLRVKEGKDLINPLLQELRNNQQSIVLKSFINPVTNTLPFIFDKQVFPYCRNLYSDENIYEQFYSLNETKDDTVSGQIIKVIKDFGVDITKLNFAIFTVINLSDYFPARRKVTNNPPNPPYVNINNLIYLRNIQKIFPNKDKLQREIDKTFDKLEKFAFYRTLSLQNAIREKYIKSNPSSDSDIIDFANSLIDLIQANNSATLIGTLADTDAMQHITFNKYPCSENIDLYNERKDFVNKETEFKLPQTKYWEELKLIKKTSPSSIKKPSPPPSVTPKKSTGQRKGRGDGSRKKRKSFRKFHKKSPK